MSQAILLIDGQNFIHKFEEVLKTKSKTSGLTDITFLNLEKLFENPLQDIKVGEKYFYGAKLHFNQDTAKKSQELISSQRKLINHIKKQGYDYIIAGNVRGQKVGRQVSLKRKVSM